MKKKEWNLSDRMVITYKGNVEDKCYFEDDVKEFIRRLKELLPNELERRDDGEMFLIHRTIDKLAGERLR